MLKPKQAEIHAAILIRWPQHPWPDQQFLLGIYNGYQFFALYPGDSYRYDL